MWRGLWDHGREGRLGHSVGGEDWVVSSLLRNRGLAEGGKRAVSKEIQEGENLTYFQHDPASCAGAFGNVDDAIVSEVGDHGEDFALQPDGIAVVVGGF